MTDWYKSLGKVYAEEASQRFPVHAYFISLGGVNGNVSGHYRDLRSQKPNVILIGGEDLLRHVETLFSVCTLEAAGKSIRRYTDKQPRSFEIAYYRRKAYWFVTFDGDSFTMLQGNGEVLAEDDVEKLTSLALEWTSASRFVDLKQDAEANERATRIAKSVLSLLMIAGGEKEHTELQVCGDVSQGDCAILGNL